MMKRWIVCVVVLLMSGASSTQAQGCAGVNTDLSPQLRKRYVEAIESTFRPASRPITVDGYMGQGDWAVVFSRPPHAERGAFFIQRKDNKYVLVKTWGGVAGPDSAESIASWARGLYPDFPASLANCFANEVKLHW